MIKPMAVGLMCATLTLCSWESNWHKQDGEEVVAGSSRDTVHMATDTRGTPFVGDAT